MQKKAYNKRDLPFRFKRLKVDPKIFVKDGINTPMDFLFFLQNLRTDFIDRLVLLLTNLGSEYGLIAISFWFLWCQNKTKGFRMFPVFFTGMTLCEALKGLLQIPRPFLRDSRLSPVADALAEAGGYSCPSGHTTCAATTFGTAACFVKKAAVRILFIVLILITMLTRMYLGVHTPADILLAAAVSAAVIALYMGLYTLCDKGKLQELWIYGFSCLLSAAAVLATQLGFDSEDGLENAPKLLGCSLAIFIAFLLEQKGYTYETNGTPFQQCLKYVGGLLVLAIVLQGLKQLFAFLALPLCLAHCIRYTLVMLTGTVLWPRTFRGITKIVPRRKDSR